MRKVYAIGEALIDQVQKNNKLVPYVGGAPLNFIASTSLNYKDAYLISLLGKDVFGKMIFDMLNQENLNKNFVEYLDCSITASSLVTLSSDGDRDFTFSKKNASFLRLNECKIPSFSKNDILYFGTVPLLSNTNIDFYQQLLNHARKEEVTIIYDPNLRYSLFNKEELIKLVNEFFVYADLVKVSIEELKDITKCNEEKKGIDLLFNQFENLKIIILSLGNEGVKLFTRNDNIYQSAIKINAVDTTGAGDTLFGGFIGYLLKNNLPIISSDINNYKDALLEGVTLASKVCLHLGSIPIIQ